MATRNSTFASLSAILFAAFFSMAASGPTNATTVSITSFRAAWSSTTTYNAGMVVTYNGASYISLISSNKNVIPSSSTTAWATLDAPGATGATGPAGVQGPAGPAGAQGVAGPSGLQGIMGNQGPMGPAGTPGVAGSVGPAGPTGATGATGPSGPQGLTGATGAAGPQGPAGTNGNGFTYQNTWSISAPYTANAVVTESGTSYIALKDNPAGIDPANDVSTSGGHWAILAAAGAQGPIGLTGATGPAGAVGAAGPMGPAGTAGATGAAGPIGLTGATGATGAQGLTGATGPSGPQGLTGATGAAGPQGPAGTNGNGFTYQNTWTSSTPYTANAVVTESGTSYIALKSNSGVDPALTSATRAATGRSWRLRVRQGRRVLQVPPGRWARRAQRGRWVPQEQRGRQAQRVQLGLRVLLDPREQQAQRELRGPRVRSVRRVP